MLSKEWAAALGADPQSAAAVIQIQSVQTLALGDWTAQTPHWIRKLFVAAITHVRPGAAYKSVYKSATGFVLAEFGPLRPLAEGPSPEKIPTLLLTKQSPAAGTQVEKLWGGYQANCCLICLLLMIPKKML